jgi:hypothetical protein
MLRLYAYNNLYNSGGNGAKEARIINMHSPLHNELSTHLG